MDIAKLEQEIYSIQDVIKSFLVSGKFKYYKHETIKSKELTMFYDMLTSANEDKQKVIIEAIISRLKTVQITTDLDEIPF